MTVEEWDLTSRISPYLDRHMVFPLLEFIDTTLLANNKVSYATSDIGVARLALLRPTHMVDYAMDAYKSVHGEQAEVPKEMEEQKEKVFRALEELKKGCAPLESLYKDEEKRVRENLFQNHGDLVNFFFLTSSFTQFSEQAYCSGTMVSVGCSERGCCHYR